MRALRAYHRLPAPARDIAAGTWGLWLNAWRRGPGSAAYRQEAIEREHWDEERWAAFEHDRLGRLLERAATEVPYYRSYWGRVGGRERPWTDLARWPVLSKEEVRSQPERFVADDRRRRWMYREHTSGSTGTPLELWWSRSTTQRWYALLDTRVLGWHGLRWGDRWAMIGGQLVAPVEQANPPFWVWNAAFHQLYMSSYHLSPANAPAYIEAMRARRVAFVFGYASSLATLARFCTELGLEPPRLRVAISNAEPLYEHQRETIRRAFDCPVVDTYGMAEIVVAGSECAAGTMHRWPEVGLVEVLGDDGEPRADGHSGRFVCTGLLNDDMILVRYDVGDRGAISGPAACDCGRSLPWITEIEGRSDDVLVLRDGRRVGRLDPVFKTDLPIREAQIVQETLDQIRVRVVPASGYDDSTGEGIVARMRERLGDVDVSIELVDAIERTSSGKFRAVVSHVEG